MCYPLARSGVFVVNFEHISQLVLVFLLLTLSRSMPTGIAGAYVRLKLIDENFRRSTKIISNSQDFYLSSF